MRIINKVAFLVHEPTMYAHYSSVWAEMVCADFAIILLSSFNIEAHDRLPSAQDFIDKIVEFGYEFHRFDDLVRDNIKFKYVVSNHMLGGRSSSPAPLKTRLMIKTKNFIKHAINFVYKNGNGSKKYQIIYSDPIQYPPLQVGLHQIRFMYGADISDGWCLADWNDIYDLFLCHGPNDETQLKKKFKGKTVLMGYPRYDTYFSASLSVNAVVSEFGIDRSKKTILWMPTYDMFGDSVCSIPYFAKAISTLMADYNVIVRPHPISFRLDPEGIELLMTLNYKIDSQATRDMNSLFRLADTVLCDHGGSAFGALYLGKKLIFLDTPNSASSIVGKNSSNYKLMQHFPVVGVRDISNLGDLLNNEMFWEDCMKNAQNLFAKFFVDYRGNSSKKAAEILGSLDTILNQ